MSVGEVVMGLAIMSVQRYYRRVFIFIFESD